VAEPCTQPDLPNYTPALAPSSSTPLRRDRVRSASSARSAPEQSPQRQKGPPRGPMGTERLNRVLGARRREAARRWATDTDLTLVDPDCRDQASRQPMFDRFGRRRERGVPAERRDQLGCGRHREDETAAAQALTDATAGFEQARIAKTRSTRCRLVVPARTPPPGTRSGIGVIGVGVVAVGSVVPPLTSSLAPSHSDGCPLCSRVKQSAAVCAPTPSRGPARNWGHSTIRRCGPMCRPGCRRSARRSRGGRC
jgi:hypothetical protein